METASASERILAAALAEFADRGFEGTSTTEIARRAGVTQPLVHYHFTSKDELWKAAVARAFSRLRGVFEGTEEEPADPLERMKAVLRRYVRFSAAHPEMARLMAREGARGGPRLRWLVQHHVRPLQERVQGLLAAAVEAGWAKPLPITSLALIFLPAAAYPFSVPALVAEAQDLDVQDPATIERHAETLIEILFHGLLVSPRTGAAGSARRTRPPTRKAPAPPRG